MIYAVIVTLESDLYKARLWVRSRWTRRPLLGEPGTTAFLADECGAKTLKNSMAKYFCLALIFVCTHASAEDFERYNQVTQYDHYFSKYSKRNFGPNFDWRYFKAQAIAESRLRKDAQSQVGAVGIMQIMPRTYAEIVKRSRYIKGSDKNPQWNIAAGIYYNRSIWKIFTEERPFQDRLDFMFGAYNAGKGNILRAQRHTMITDLNPNLWASIEETLPRVTGKHSKETIAYVDTIKEVKSALK